MKVVFLVCMLSLMTFVGFASGISIVTTDPAPGRPIVAQVEGEAGGVLELHWSRLSADDAAEPVDCAQGGAYVPTEADLEHWIRVEAFENGVPLGQDSVYFSRLPVVYLDTDDGLPVVDKEIYKPASLVIQGNAEFARQYVGRTEVRGRGNSSWTYPQKPFKLKLDSKVNLFGWGKNKHWVLIPCFNDKSLVRNKMADALANELGLCSMDKTWVSVVLNGRYNGVYMISEQIRVDSNRIDVFDWEKEGEDVAGSLYKAMKKTMGWSSEVKDDLETRMVEDLSWVSSGIVEYGDRTFDLGKLGLWAGYDVSGGYVFEVDQKFEGCSKFITEGGLRVSVDAPESMCSDPSMFAFATNLWRRFESAYRSPNGCNPEGEFVSDLADFDSMVAYWLVNEVMANGDTFNSRYVHIDRGGRLVFGPVWDFDHGASTWSTMNIPNNWWTLVRSDSDNWFVDWLKNPAFRERAYELYWTKVRPWFEAYFSDGGMLSTYESFLQEAGKASDRRWHGEPCTINPAALPRTWMEDIAIFRKFMVHHVAWLDEQFATPEKLSEATHGRWGYAAALATEDAFLDGATKEGYFVGKADYFGWMLDEMGNLIGKIVLKASKAKKGTCDLRAVVTIDGRRRVVRGSVPTEGERVGVASGNLSGLVLDESSLHGNWSGYRVVGGIVVDRAGTEQALEMAKSCGEKAYSVVLERCGGGGNDMVSIVLSSRGRALVTVISPNGRKISYKQSLVYGGGEFCGLPVKMGRDDRIDLMCWFDSDGEMVAVYVGVDNRWLPLAFGRGEWPEACRLDVPPEDVESLLPFALTEFLPNDVLMTISRKGRMETASRPGCVRFNVNLGKLETTTANPSGMRFSFLPKKGMFSGSFSIYEQKLKGGVRRCRVTVAGVFVDGVGYGTARVRGSGNIAVLLR